MAKMLCFGLLTLSFIPHQAAASGTIAQAPDPSHSLFLHEAATSFLTAGKTSVAALHPKRANFEQEQKSRDAQLVADWVVDSADNRGLPFAIVDKTDAKVFVFDSAGRLLGAAPVLLGIAKGDDSAPGIGERKLSDIRPDERTTPAGRFEASIGYNYSGKDVLWVDYETSVSMHRVVTSNPAERRLERLSTPTPLDNRISFGCINVPEKFFNSVVSPTFTGTTGIVYVLPETRPSSEIFARYYDVDSRWKTGVTAQFHEGAR